MREGPNVAVNQAIIWLPTGVAVSGLWWLGLSSWWIVALTTVAQRLLLGYPLHVALPAAVGSTFEAILGVLVLRRLEFRAALTRLRDVVALMVAAGIAPIGSILCSWIARAVLWSPDRPFYSGWDGWWRMNALGAVTVVPLALTWLDPPLRRVGLRAAAHAVLVVVGPVGLLFLLMRLAPPGITGVLLLDLALPAALYAGVRFGPRGAVTAGALSALLVSVAATYGYGPFSAVPRPERHVALQLFELTFATFPLLFGALIAERQAALAGGLQSEERRNAIQQALPDIAYRIRADGSCLDMYVPKGMPAPFPTDELVGRRTLEFVPPEHAEHFLKTIRRVLSERATITLEYELPVRGRRRIREARCVPYGPDEMLAVVRDITDRKQAEATIAFEAKVLELVATGRPTSEVFSAIVEGIERLTRDGLCSIILLDNNRMRVAMAPSFPEQFNAAIDGIEIGPAAGSCPAAACLGRSIVVEDLATDPLWAAHRGHALPYGLRACWSVPIRDSAARVLGTFAVYCRQSRAPDPEELALAERAGALAGIAVERERRGEDLRRSEELLASINRNVNEGLFRTTPELRLVYANRAFARLFGYDLPDGILAPADAMATDDFEDPMQLRELIAEQAGGGREVNFRRRDGSHFWALVSNTEVRGPDGAVQYYDGAIADITSRKELEAQFRHSQKMEAVGKLAGGIAHDFNNLLTAIFGYAELIQRESTPGGQVCAHAEGVLHAAKRAASLTRQLLAYSRQQVLSPQVLDLATVVDQLGGMSRRLIGENIRLVTQHKAFATRVRVDRGQVEQVILNLVVNARDAMPTGGTLTLRTSLVEVDEAAARVQADLHPGSYVAVCVQDTGEGMPQDVQARAFDPFFTTKQQGRGTGLGLSTVYGIVKQSGGAVWLDSQPGRGTMAWVYLPRVEAELALEAPAAPQPVSALEATVLVVEDEPVVSALVRETLRRAGYVVVEAVDGVDALELSRRHSGSIDLVVTDVVMPRMGGRELAGALLAERPGLKVLFMSGYPNDALDLRGFAGTDADFISKPFASGDLLDRTRKLLHPGAVGT